MDYLDANKELRQRIILLIGYVLVAIAIVIATLILVYQAYGFGVNKNGTVIQNGLVFFSSQPSRANIYLNGTLRPETTNSRIILPSGIYQAKLTRSGYRDWNRSLIVNGGMVEHFDYPVLFPNTLSSHSIANYPSAPGLMTQSPDHRWLVVQKVGSISDFDLYDSKTPLRPVITTLTLPSGILTKASSSESWQVVEWSDDNQHILMEHLFDNKTEFILINTNDATQSINLNTSLNVAPSVVSLNNKKFDSYYIYNSATEDLQTVDLNNRAPVTLIAHVLAYKSYGDKTVLYVTSDGAEKNKVKVKINAGGSTYDIRSLPASKTYLINLTTYSGTLYVAAGSNADNRVYIYEDPAGQISNQPNSLPSPLWVLHVPNPNYLSFSNNAQFIVAENGTNFATYDIENKLGYLFNESSTLGLDAPQTNATWMDGDRLTYISHGQLYVEDYDNNNQQKLIKASGAYIPAFSADYKYVYTISVNASGQYDMEQTPLLNPSDL